jgi:hypothetical protein
MQRSRRCLIYVITLAAVLSGCWVLPVPQTGDRSVDANKLDSLIGADEAAVINTIGRPKYRLSGANADYLVYRGHIDSTGVVFMFWVPVGIDVLDKDRLDCLRLEFKDGLLYRYDFKTHSLLYDEVPRKLGDCRQLFWKRDELRALSASDTAPAISAEELFAKAEGGDAEAQLQLYHSHEMPDRSRLEWLCRSADQGYPNAQAEVGRIYNMGLFGIPVDRRQAYVWYALAIQKKPESWKTEYLTVKTGLSPQQLLEAEAMLAAWKPGQCHRDFINRGQTTVF